jgi:resuscitation-promoting factor RpfA
MIEEAPAPAAAASAAPAPPARTELDSVVVTGARIAREPADSARTASAPAALRAQRAAPAVAAKSDAAAPRDAPPEDDATTAAVDADALLPRRQWLQRIRERRDAGDHDTARASLERYLQHYPEVRVPRDLRALLEN